MKKIHLVMIVMLLMTSQVIAELTRNDSNETVTDSLTGLMWQDDSYAASVKKNWQGAIDYCETLTLGGYNDWLLPNKRELLSIADRSKSGPAIDNTFHNYSSTYYVDYWSSTTDAGNSNNAWGVYFGDGGYSFNFLKSGTRYVRCVRPGQ
ncbi:DUF1566 domain-containing protein [Limisalsivibrio acetivorans]|uniref:Lcl C-terminal domain-containing protein n=1 Tax=Limisalsivibrio acetivorans TaxID=1304888 RepID=UPI0003B69FD1|nr:DUF1566 domain-containing protein [Limisalsivibrio acetivorans]